MNQEFLEYAIRVSVEADFLDKERETLERESHGHMGDCRSRRDDPPNRHGGLVHRILSEDVLAIIEEEGFSLVSCRRLLQMRSRVFWW